MADDEETVRNRIAGENRGKSVFTPCRTRTDRLALPTQRRYLALYLCHASHLTRCRVQLIKQNLQELYAMTPEETERYFLDAYEKERKMALRRRLRKILRKEFRKRKQKAQEDCAYKFFYWLLVQFMCYASRHPAPPLVCARFRNLSDIVLEQLCDLRNLDHPSREDPDKIGLFMITISDWFAIAIELIYYVVQLKKNKELDEIERQYKYDRPRDEIEVKSDIPTDTTGGVE